MTDTKKTLITAGIFAILYAVLGLFMASDSESISVVQGVGVTALVGAAAGASVGASSK